MVECASGTHGCSDGDTHADAAGEGVKDTEECFGLIRRSILVDGDEDIVIAKHGGDPEKGSEKVGNDVE